MSATVREFNTLNSTSSDFDQQYVCKSDKPETVERNWQLNTDGMQFRPGDAASKLAAAASEHGYNVHWANGDLTITIKWMENFEHFRGYYVAVADGKIRGVTACANFESGKVDRLFDDALASLGEPFEVWATDLPRGLWYGFRAKWSNGDLVVSGSPNLLRLSIGKLPRFFAGRGYDWEYELARRLIKDEDRYGRDAARLQIEQEYCLTEQDLTDIIVPQLPGLAND